MTDHAIVRCEQRTRNRDTRRERVKRLIDMNKQAREDWERREMDQIENLPSRM